MLHNPLHYILFKKNLQEENKSVNRKHSGFLVLLHSKT